MIVQHSPCRAEQRAAAALQRTLGVPSFAYTVEQIWAAFAAVHHWPSPEAHETKRNVLSGDVIRGWWQHVTRKYTPLLGTNAARRLTSYLIHEPSLVLWARAQRSRAWHARYMWHIWHAMDRGYFAIGST